MDANFIVVILKKEFILAVKVGKTLQVVKKDSIVLLLSQNQKQNYIFIQKY
jgi:hypothetical protein